METFTAFVSKLLCYIILTEQGVRRIHMSNNKLISYIASLSPEQLEKLIKELPRLTSLLQGQAPPCPQEQSSQTQ